MSDLDDLSIPDMDSVSGSTTAGTVEAGLAFNARCFASRPGFGLTVSPPAFRVGDVVYGLRRVVTSDV